MRSRDASTGPTQWLEHIFGSGVQYTDGRSSVAGASVVIFSDGRVARLFEVAGAVVDLAAFVAVAAVLPRLSASDGTGR